MSLVQKQLIVSALQASPQLRSFFSLVQFVCFAQVPHLDVCFQMLRCVVLSLPLFISLLLASLLVIFLLKVITVMIKVADTETSTNFSEMGGSDDEFDNGNERSCSCTIM